ncbi:hypothetical protein GE21DRAFT_10656 [Neurospora crassa]|uniref:Uncharacterized protein n=1 Tax=Neurospora crassa (strain ATCC 24698 / 74-OR23-1A / CBS 708.71 / DSM 1257 / FGSC 987) TaxID=367110 RepID=Q7S5Q6_NEUCR|nr:hypothetical protein NCU05787 [Neurospora crassa OR74A]EAA30811.1 hypothetical protein NCU05787 [Neurospora crassa OR74A]KHE86631.1 hypothetical protein GE21DRAFT_10656 [Neurospora crassa]|eukprot:XP_960047.1 hypothetical protein NCU05787 [Neurospora crassa OR74A]
MCQTGSFRGPATTTTTSRTDEQLGQLRAGFRPADLPRARRSVERNLKPYLATDGKGRRSRGPFACRAVGSGHAWRDGVSESRFMNGEELLALKSFAKEPNVAQRKRGKRAPRHDTTGEHFPDGAPCGSLALAKHEIGKSQPHKAAFFFHRRLSEAARWWQTGTNT